MILLYILMNVLYATIGVIEAWGYSGQSFMVGNIKKLLVLFRSLMTGVVLFTAYCIQLDLVVICFLAPALMFSFSFFHNGFYEVSKAIYEDRYVRFTKHFTDLSKNDSSIFSFDFASRTYQLLFSILTLMCVIVILHDSF